MPHIVVQIPCFNEQETLPATVADIRAVMADNQDCVLLVVDDGSTDLTIEAARRAGVDYVARLSHHSGLARTFMAGLHASLRLGADVIVNTDGDNQYSASDIPKLIAPIYESGADIVIGARSMADIRHFSRLKRLLQWLGSRTIQLLSGADIPDATSGFRAIRREAALRLNVFTPFTYTLETIIQAGRSGMIIVSVPVATNAPTRPSRLFSSMAQYVVRSVAHMLRIFTVYEPFKTYAALGLVPFTVALGLGCRYLLLISFADPTRSHAPSLILAAVLFVLAFVLWAIGILSDLVGVNRRLLEDIQSDQRRARLRAGAPFDPSDRVDLVHLKEPSNVL